MRQNHELFKNDVQPVYFIHSTVQWMTDMTNKSHTSERLGQKYRRNRCRSIPDAKKHTVVVKERDDKYPIHVASCSKSSHNMLFSFLDCLLMFLDFVSVFYGSIGMVSLGAYYLFIFIRRF